MQMACLLRQESLSAHTLHSIIYNLCSKLVFAMISAVFFCQPGSWRKVLKKRERGKDKEQMKGQMKRQMKRQQKTLQKGQQKELKRVTMAGRRLFTRKSKVSTDF